MSIRKRIYISLVLSVSGTLVMSLVFLFFVSSRIVDRRVKQTYELVYQNYKEILSREERNLKLLDETGDREGNYYLRRKLQTQACDEKPHYRVLYEGPFYGINRQFGDGCYFVGVNLEEVLRLLQGLINVDWIVYYDRKLLGSVLEVSMDLFVKDKIVMSDILIDRLSNPKLLYLPLDVKGFILYGNHFERTLLMEMPFTDLSGLPVGRVILVKDVSAIYRETYLVFVTLALYSVVIVSLLASVLFRIASRLANRIIFLKEVTSSIEKKDFSVVELLEDSKDGWKDEVYELKHSIYNMAISLKNAFEELEKKRKELEQLAYYDPLTGLPNRRFFFDHANLMVESAKRYNSPLTVFIIDIDFFKKINDTYGHDAGDLVLKTFAGVLSKSVRHSDVPARLGGEEFVVLMPNTNLQQAKVVAERVRVNFQNTLMVYNGQEIRATLSGGLASFSQGMSSIDEVISLADEALYKAKQSGRNRIEVNETKK